MSMRPIQFSKRGPSTPLAIGGGAAQGLDNALDSYAKLHMQKLQMQAMQAKNTANAQFQQAKAASVARQNQDADMSRVQAVVAHAQLARNNGDPDAAKAYMKAAQPMIDKLAQNMPKDQADQMTAHAKMQLNNGQWPQEFGSESLNPNEQKMFGQLQGNQTKEAVAQTGAGAKVQAAQTYADSRTGVATIGAGARIQSANISAGTRGPQLSKADQMNLKASQQRETDLATRFADADKANAMGMSPDPADVANKRAMLKSMMDDEHSKQAQIMGSQPGQKPAAQSGAQQQPQTPASGFGPTPNGYGGAPAPAQPKILPMSQYQQAQPGDLVKHDNGQVYKALGNNSFVPAQMPSQSAGPSQAPTQSAPAPAAPPQADGQ